MSNAEKKEIRLGVIGTGRIANRFIPETKVINGVFVNSVFNPNAKSVKQFGEKHNISNAFTKLEDLFNNVDAIYIASPHSTHYEYIRAALLYHKHVLCEKPMVLKKSQAIELYRLAKQRELVLMEGIKTAYSPGFSKILQIVRSGKIGTVKDVEATFTKLEEPFMRELTDTATGGSFLELASYTLLAIVKTLGIAYKEFRFDSYYADNGLDLYTKAYITYKDSFATSKTGLGVKSEGQLIISGTKGYVRVPAPWWKPQTIEVCYEDVSLNESYYEEFLGDGLRYEIHEFISQIRGYKQKKSKLTPEESILLSEFMEKFLTDREMK